MFDIITNAMSGNFNLAEALSSVFATLLIIFTVLPLHEFAHAWSAYKLGDGTAKMMGRLTLNPMAHVDWIGAAMIMAFGFGWARPVPVNMRNFSNPKWGMALTSLAGPVSNLIAGFISRAIYHLLIFAFSSMLLPSGILLTVMQIVVYLFYFLSEINVGLAVFNLLPVPPLDGSRLLTAILPDRVYYKIMAYERYIMLGLMLLIFMGVFTLPLSLARNGIMFLFDLPFKLLIPNS